MAEFGYHTIGGTPASNGGDFEIVSKETLGEDGDVSKLTAYIDGSPTGAAHIRAVIYSDNAGTPNVLLGTGTDLTTLIAGFGPDWFDLPFPSPVSLTAGVYWIGFHFGNGTVGFNRYSDTLANNLKFKAQTFTSGPINPFGAPGGGTNERVAIYGTYTPIAVPGAASVEFTFGTSATGSVLSPPPNDPASGNDMAPLIVITNP